MKKTKNKPKNAPKNIEWNSQLGVWMALIATNEKGEETWQYWNKHGYLFCEISYHADDTVKKNTQFPPENKDKNAVYVVPYDKWVVPEKAQEEDDFEAFRTTLVYGFEDIFCEFAGGEKIYVNDHEIASRGKNRIYPESGDWVFYDKRCQAGTFGVSHDDFSIRKVTVKNPQEHHIDYNLKKIKRAVSTDKLNRRYIWLAFFFCNWEHREFETPYNYLWDKKAETFAQNAEALNKTFAKEIKQLKDDPYLAMYWLLHMGICCDERYQQVKQQVIELELNKNAVNGDDYMLKKIQQCLVFFEQLDDEQNLSLDSKYHEITNRSLFLIRRANAIFATQSRCSDKQNHFDKWWLSVMLFPQLNDSLIRRIYWLEKNISKFNQWDKLDLKLKAKHIDVKKNRIVLLDYLTALNPDTKSKFYYANRFLLALQQHKSEFGNRNNKAFTQTMLWKLKGLYTNDSLLKEMLEYYFNGAFDKNEYQELMQTHFAKDNTLAIKALLSQLDAVTYDNPFDEMGDVESGLSAIQAIIHKAAGDVLFAAMQHSTSDILRAYIFVAILNDSRSDKAQLIIKLSRDDSHYYDTYIDNIVQLFSQLSLYKLSISEISPSIWQQALAVCHQDFTSVICFIISKLLTPTERLQMAKTVINDKAYSPHHYKKTKAIVQMCIDEQQFYSNAHCLNAIKDCLQETFARTAEGVNFEAHGAQKAEFTRSK